MRLAALLALSLDFLTPTVLAGPATNATIYRVKGVFLSSRAAGRTATITHESIPGYMDAMTMDFQVKTPAELKDLKPQDQISFRLSVTETDAWIDEIKKAGDGVIRRSLPPPPEPGPELPIGSPLPDCVLTNQDGKTIHLREFKGQALALTFFFSRCPLPTFCPKMNSNLAAVQQALANDPTRTNWQLLSVSFDPSFDTPQFLGTLASNYKNDPLHWAFATSSLEEVSKLGGAFGLRFWHQNGVLNHNLRTAVIDASGRLRKVFTGNEWEPAELVGEMKKAMAAGR